MAASPSGSSLLGVPLPRREQFSRALRGRSIVRNFEAFVERLLGRKH